MKMLAVLVVCIGMSGCFSDDGLRLRVEKLERDRDMLANASIKNSEAIVKLSDAVHSNASSIDKLCDAIHNNMESIRMISRRI